MPLGAGRPRGPEVLEGGPKFCLWKLEERVDRPSRDSHLDKRATLIWLVRGRGVDALGMPQGILTRPPVIIQLAREVKASGVRIIVSTEALQQQQIPVASLDPTTTDLVDNTAMLMAELVSRGYQVIRY
jgi:hypothetical protein